MGLDAIDKKILQRIQRDIPIVERPFLAVARELGLEETALLDRLQRLTADGYVRRIAPIANPEAFGRVSTLVAMSVPEEDLEGVAATIGTLDEVSHSYSRRASVGSVPYNLWFTLATDSQSAIADLLHWIETETGYVPHSLPSTRKFKISVILDFEA